MTTGGILVTNNPSYDDVVCSGRVARIVCLGLLVDFQYRFLYTFNEKNRKKSGELMEGGLNNWFINFVVPDTAPVLLNSEINFIKT